MNWKNNSDPAQGPDLGDVLAELRNKYGGNWRRLGPVLLLLLVGVLAYMGTFKVEPGSEGVVLRFGKLHRQVGPGLRFSVPFVEKVRVVNLEEVRRAEIGFRGDKLVPAEALMLTGDENIVEVRMAVQYRVNDPIKFLFRIAEPEETLHTAAEVAIRTVAGQTKIDEMMTMGRAQVQSDTRALLQRLMDDYDSGVLIAEVKLDNVDAPDEVKDAFNAVTRAREEKEKLINQAQGYAEDRVPRARGEAARIEREAEGYKEERVLRAKGDVARFTSLLGEYQKAPQITRTRLHLEAMQRVLAAVDEKTLIDGRVAGNALPLLSLGAANRPARATTRPQPQTAAAVAPPVEANE